MGDPGQESKAAVIEIKEDDAEKALFFCGVCVCVCLYFHDA